MWISSCNNRINATLLIRILVIAQRTLFVMTGLYNLLEKHEVRVFGVSETNNFFLDNNCIRSPYIKVVTRFPNLQEMQDGISWNATEIGNKNYLAVESISKKKTERISLI